MEENHDNNMSLKKRQRPLLDDAPEYKLLKDQNS